MNIKNEEAYKMARELAELEGNGMTTVVIEALREKLSRVRADQSDEGLAEKLLNIGREAAPLWQEPWRSNPHGDLLYDDNGLPN